MRRHLGTVGIVVATAAAVWTAPALARTVVDYARNAGHVHGFAAAPAIHCPNQTSPAYPAPPCPRRARKLVATDDKGYLPNDIIRRARNAARLGGLGPDRFQQTCEPGTIAGFAQVPGDVRPNWTKVAGYGQSLVIGGAYPGVHFCSQSSAFAKQTSPGVYEVTFKHSCGPPSIPPPGETLPALVTVNSDQELIATYTTSCVDNWVQQNVTIRATDGMPTGADFTLAQLEPITYLAP